MLRASAAGTVDVMPGFIDLATQGLALLGRKPSLARMLGLSAHIAGAVLTFRPLGAGISRLAALIPALARILVPLLSQSRHRA